MSPSSFQEPSTASAPVLIIDDDRAFCALIRDYLSAFGYAVAAAHTGPSGVDKAISEPWRAIILDVMLPGCDGFEVLRQIRRRSDVPVLMLTARGDETDQIAGLAREAGETPIDVAVPDSLRCQADPELLARAFGNVVRNALRYAGDAGPIEISTVQREKEIVVSIADHGPGVPPDALDRLFDPFFRPDTARTQETGGSGLGLAIVKSCVGACAGRVAVHNRAPHGLIVEFHLQPEGDGGPTSLPASA